MQNHRSTGIVLSGTNECVLGIIEREDGIQESIVSEDGCAEKLGRVADNRADNRVLAGQHKLA